MKLRRIRIQGFRSISDLSLEIDDFLCFIGQNNHGKSNIFYALDLFFSSGTRKLTPDIFFRSPAKTAKEVKIEARFEDLSPAEMEKLGPWTVDGNLTVSKKYWIDSEGKKNVEYAALMKVPSEEWLREDFKDYNKREIVSQLPIAEFLPERGRVTKQAYKKAIRSYIEAYPDKVEWTEEKRINPAGYKEVLDGYLPEFQLVPAVRYVSEETKTSGDALFSKILSIVINCISKNNPAFQKLQDILQEIKKLVEGERPEEKLVEIKDLEEKLKGELKLWNVDLDIGVSAPDIEKIFQLGTTIIVDDGIRTDITQKGHGLQRSLIFALVRIWAAESKKVQTEGSDRTRERSHIFAFEEPELFLHPQMCRATYESLKEISKTDQILISTHSPHFIRMEDYRHIVIVKKPDLETGTTVHKVQEELFEGEKKKRFNMIRFFNPDRNELFFARKVVLVEGATEKVVFPLLAKRLDCFDHSVSIIDCGSKFNLTLYMEVLNAFGIPYLVIHDEDPVDPELEPGGSKHDPEKLREAQRTFNENERIRQALNPSVGKIKMIHGEFENLLGISRSKAERIGKPLAAVEKYSEETTIPAKLEKLVRKVYM
ncbi:TPA: ATP-dependent endonuclease [Candidatus Bathyarchaeota archaeon]|nr:ATP-dependent endonuclease [Candidatus Bathyarchaeota archaeon]